MGEWITPPSLPPTTYCRRLLIPNTPEWIGAVTGAIMELTYASAWRQTTGITQEDAADRARVMFNLYLNSGNDGECGDMACCGDSAKTYRVNPDTGQIEQSSDSGSTWTPAAGTIQSVIVTPQPPVTSGAAATKCDAATNVSGQVDGWITQVSNDFTTSTTLLEFGLAVLAAVVGAVLVVITGGALEPLEALFLSAVGAGLAAAWGAGKAVFDAYWTTDIKDKILCAAYENISDDGSYTDAQFSAFWNKVNADLPSSPAKMLFMGFLSSVGTAGLNAMAASGMSADADCADCDPTCVDDWQWNAELTPEGADPVRTSNSYSVTAYPAGPYHYLTISSVTNTCCHISVEILSGTFTLAFNGVIPCPDLPAYTFADEATPPWINNTIGLWDADAFALKMRSSTAFRAKITFS